MEAVELSFTTEQQLVFDEFCSLLSAPKRRELAREYSHDKSDDNVDIKILSDLRNNQNIKVFEAFHIIEFYKETKKSSEYKTAIIKEFKVRTKKPRTEGEITKIASEGAYSRKATEEIFRILAKARNSSLPQCFLDFLKYCQAEKFSIRGFDNSKDLEEFISSLEKHLNPSNEIDNIQSICVRDGLISLTSNPHTIELSTPNNSASKNINNVASILTWDCHLTPLIGRDKELEELHEWAESKPDKSIKIICGEGGMGKTRLAFHFAEQLKEQGWSAGQISFVQEGIYKAGSQGILLVIDYPEDKIRVVEKLLHSLKNLELTDIKLRILLLSRNESFLQPTMQYTQQFLANSLTLRGLEQSSWELFQAAWQEIKKLETNIVNPTITLPDFEHWKQQSETHERPLLIVSLAYYLSQGLNDANDISGLSGRKILRYISSREILRIKNEVESYLANTSNAMAFDYQGVALLIAVSAISDGLDDPEIRNITNVLSTTDTDYPPVPVKQIKQLSMWKSKSLAALTPDLLAADFLAFCMENFAEYQEGYWLLAMLRGSKLARDSNTLKTGFSRLDRLVYDNDITLQDSKYIAEDKDNEFWLWPVERIANSFKSDEDTCANIIKSLNINECGRFSRKILEAAYSITAEAPVPETQLSDYLQQKAIFLYKENDNSSIEVGLEAVNVTAKLLETYPEDYDIMLSHANNLFNMSNFYWSNMDDDNALLYAQNAYTAFQHIIEKGSTTSKIVVSIAKCQKSLSNIYLSKGLLDYAESYIRNALGTVNAILDADISEDVVFEKSCMLTILSDILGKQEKFDEAHKKISEACNILMGLCVNNPEFYSSQLLYTIKKKLKYLNIVAEADEFKLTADIIIDLSRKLTKAQYKDLRYQLAKILVYQTWVVHDAQTAQEAYPLVKEARDVYETLLRNEVYDEVERESIWSDYRQCLSVIAQILAALQRYDEAIDALKIITNHIFGDDLSSPPSSAAALACWKIGLYEKKLGNISSATNYLTYASNGLQHPANAKEFVTCTGDLSLLLFENKKYQESYQWSLTAIPVLENLCVSQPNEYLEKHIQALRFAGITCFFLSAFSNALDHVNKAIVLFNEYNNNRSETLNVSILESELFILRAKTLVNIDIKNANASANDARYALQKLQVLSEVDPKAYEAAKNDICAFLDQMESLSIS